MGGGGKVAHVTVCARYRRICSCCTRTLLFVQRDKTHTSTVSMAKGKMVVHSVWKYNYGIQLTMDLNTRTYGPMLRIQTPARACLQTPRRIHALTTGVPREPLSPTGRLKFSVWFPAGMCQPSGATLENRLEISEELPFCR